MLQGIETVTILRRTTGAYDAHGLPGEDWTPIEVSGVLVGFGSTSEPVTVDADPQKITVTLYFPNGTVIEADDKFIIRGEEYVKDGRQMDWITPLHGLDVGVVVQVRQYLG